MTLMIIGEICNFIAYAFTEAILVTPLGALAVVVSAIGSSIFLKERLSFVGKVGCFLCILGAVTIVLNAPEHQATTTIQEMQKYAISKVFLPYAGIILLIAAFMAFWVGPRYGSRHMLVYITICSIVGGISVVCLQGFGAAFVSAIGGTPNQWNQWFLWVLLVFVIFTLLVEINYLNKALNLFNTSVVTPTYFTFFTSMTLISSAVLFQGLNGTGTQIATIVMGFLTIVAGVVLLQVSLAAQNKPDSQVLKGELNDMPELLTAPVDDDSLDPGAASIRGALSIRRLATRKASQASAIAHLHRRQTYSSRANDQNGRRFASSLQSVFQPYGNTTGSANTLDGHQMSFDPAYLSPRPAPIPGTPTSVGATGLRDHPSSIRFVNTERPYQSSPIVPRFPPALSSAANTPGSRTGPAGYALAPRAESPDRYPKMPPAALSRISTESETPRVSLDFKAADVLGDSSTDPDGSSSDLYDDKLQYKSPHVGAAAVRYAHPDASADDDDDTIGSLHVPRRDGPSAGGRDAAEEGTPSKRDRRGLTGGAAGASGTAAQSAADGARRPSGMAHLGNVIRKQFSFAQRPQHHGYANAAVTASAAAGNGRRDAAPTASSFTEAYRATQQQQQQRERAHQRDADVVRATSRNGRHADADAGLGEEYELTEEESVGLVGRGLDRRGGPTGRSR